MRLYDHLSSGNGYKVRLIARLLGLPFERVEMDIDGGATQTPAFLALNPDGRIPLLVVADGRRLAQSNAILCYLAEGSEFFPADRYLRAEVLQWLFWEQNSHEPNIASVRRWLTHEGMLTPERQAALPGKVAAGKAALDLMDRHLTARDWLVGDRFSVADIALYAYTHVAGEGDFDLGPFASLRAWLERVAAVPGHIAITDPCTAATIPYADAFPNERPAL